TYCTANPTEGCPDSSAPPGIPGNRSDKGAPGGASSGTPDGARGNGLAGRRGRFIVRRTWVGLRPGSHRDIKEYQSCGLKHKNEGSSHFQASPVTRGVRFEVSGGGLRVPESRGEQPQSKQNSRRAPSKSAGCGRIVDRDDVAVTRHGQCFEAAIRHIRDPP